MDTLISANFAAPTSRILAVRLEGKNKPVFLWVMDNRDVWSRSEIVTFLKGVFRVSREQVRKYGNYRIYSLNIGGKMLHYAVEEGMILLSGSELYVEDALKQFEREAEGKKINVHYENINKYFSAGAGMNVFLNTACFPNFYRCSFRPKKCFRAWTSPSVLSGVHWTGM